eukprot:2348301-Lingulodinium_polyedra.AAC.1
MCRRAYMDAPARARIQLHPQHITHIRGAFAYEPVFGQSRLTSNALALNVRSNPQQAYRNASRRRARARERALSAPSPEFRALL